MPKGYGYDKAPKKASGFKMKGYSYPGESPMRKETGAATPATPAAPGAPSVPKGGGKPTNDGEKKSPVRDFGVVTGGATAAGGATAGATAGGVGTAAGAGAGTAGGAGAATAGGAGGKPTNNGKKKSPMKGAAKEGRKTRSHQAYQRGIEQAQEFSTIESSQIADERISYVGSPMNDLDK